MKKIILNRSTYSDRNDGNNWRQLLRQTDWTPRITVSTNADLKATTARKSVASTKSQTQGFDTAERMSTRLFVFTSLSSRANR